MWTSEVKKGFYLGLGVMGAVVVAGFAAGLIRTASR